jgi:RNA polymerase sigma factor (sigma-70 family)
MGNEFQLNGSGGQFPQTRWSVLEAARSDDAANRRRALGTLIAAYWKPVYKYIRLRWNRDHEQSRDLTQEFFARLLEKDFLGVYDPTRARLRTFLRTCVDGLVMNQDKAGHRLKRGGDVQVLSLDYETAEGEMAQIDVPAPEQLDDFFAREFARSLFSLAIERLRKECESKGKLTHFQLFDAYDVEEGGKQFTYEEVGRQFGIKPTDVTNYLSWARREFRRIVLDQLREMTASEDEFRREARSLLGMDVL